MSRTAGSINFVPAIRPNPDGHRHESERSYTYRHTIHHLVLLLVGQFDESIPIDPLNAIVWKCALYTCPLGQAHV